MITVLPKLFTLAFSIYTDVRAAVDVASDNGKKITAQEWGEILANATAKLAALLTEVFGKDLDPAAQRLFIAN